MIGTKIITEKMRKILIAGGDSNTEPNKWKMWPELLADKLDMDFVNLGKSGQGNEYIFNTTIEEIHKHDNIGLVVVGWSTAPRRDYLIDKQWYANRWDEKGNSDYFIKRTLQFQYSFQSICQNLKIPYLQFCSLMPWNEPVGFSCGYKGVTPDEVWPEAGDTAITKLKWIEKFTKETLFSKIDDNHFYGWPGFKELGGLSVVDEVPMNERISEQDLHPNAKGQETITEMLYEKVNELNKLH